MSRRAIATSAIRSGRVIWSTWRRPVSPASRISSPTSIPPRPQCTRPGVADDIGQALVVKALAPGELFVDSAYVSAELLVKSRETYGIALRGPTRPNLSWQKRTAGAYELDDFAIDWKRRQVRCPQGKTSVTWSDTNVNGRSLIHAQFSRRDCEVCASRPLCTRAKPPRPRTIAFASQRHYEALRTAQAWYASDEGRRQYACRAGVEGTVSQGVRAFGMRRSRYRGFSKTHLQNLAIASAINLDRLVAWFDGRPRALTRRSRLAMLAPHAQWGQVG